MAHGGTGKAGANYAAHWGAPYSHLHPHVPLSPEQDQAMKDLRLELMYQHPSWSTESAEREARKQLRLPA